MDKKIDAQALSQALATGFRLALGDDWTEKADKKTFRALPIIDEPFERPSIEIDSIAQILIEASPYTKKWGVHGRDDTSAETERKNQLIWETLVASGCFRGNYEGLVYAYRKLHKTPKRRINQAKPQGVAAHKKRGRPRRLTTDLAASLVLVIDKIKVEHGIKKDTDAIRFFVTKYYTERGRSQLRAGAIAEKGVKKAAVRLCKSRKMLKSQLIDY